MKRKAMAELSACLALLNSQYDCVNQRYQTNRDIELSDDSGSWSDLYWRLKSQRESLGNMIEQVSSEIYRRESRKPKVSKASVRS